MSIFYLVVVVLLFFVTHIALSVHKKRCPDKWVGMEKVDYVLLSIVILLLCYVWAGIAALTALYGIYLGFIFVADKVAQKVVATLDRNKDI